MVKPAIQGFLKAFLLIFLRKVNRSFWSIEVIDDSLIRKAAIGCRIVNIFCWGDIGLG
jgi:hypothetical protein